MFTVIDTDKVNKNEVKTIKLEQNDNYAMLNASGLEVNNDKDAKGMQKIVDIKTKEHETIKPVESS